MKKYLGMLAILVIVACNNTEKKVTESKDSSSVDSAKQITTQFKDQKLQGIYTSYISLKNSLVAAKLSDAQQAAGQLSVGLKNYSGCENTSLIADKIQRAKDLVTQRKEFTHVSSDVIALFKHADLSSGTIFVQHCPMANNGDGGDWLAAEKKIQNPYYGDEMLECGSVIEEIKSK